MKLSERLMRVRANQLKRRRGYMEGIIHIIHESVRDDECVHGMIESGGGSRRSESDMCHDDMD